MFNRSLVPLMLGRRDDSALRHACAIARDCGATVRVLVGMSAVAPLIAGWDYFPAGVYDTLDEATKAAAATLAADVPHVLGGAGVAVEIDIGGAFWMTPGEQAMHAAYAADLLVLQRPGDPTDADRHLFAALLLGSGRPLLWVPDMEPVPARRILLAWKTAREATRATHDAMPLLRIAERVEAVRVMHSATQARDPDEMLLAHLARHGVQAQPITMTRDGRSTGERLIAHARESGAQLIVAGGYGRARVSEQVFGGMTEALYRHAPVPVLFSH